MSLSLIEENYIFENDLHAAYHIDPASWIISKGNHVVANIHKEDWANEDIDFASKEAGQMLLGTIAELRVAFEDAHAGVEDVNEKNREQIVKDIRQPSMAIKPESTPNQDQGTSKNVAKEVLKLMSDILDAADTYGSDKKAHLAAIVELEEIYNKLTQG